jgi:hypothetical protein
MGLLFSPFIHVHVEGDDSHGHHQAAVVHAHFLESEQGRHSSSGLEMLEIGDEHHHHQGSAVTALAASSRRIEPLFAIAQGANVLIVSLGLSGHAVELTVRAHDPPPFTISRPRSPPSC